MKKTQFLTGGKPSKLLPPRADLAKTAAGGRALRDYAKATPLGIAAQPTSLLTQFMPKPMR